MFLTNFKAHKRRAQINGLTKKAFRQLTQKILEYFLSIYCHLEFFFLSHIENKGHQHFWLFHTFFSYISFNMDIANPIYFKRWQLVKRCCFFQSTETNRFLAGLLCEMISTLTYFHKDNKEEISLTQ